MLKPTKGMGHPSPPPSLANAARGRASDGGSEGMAERSPYSILKRSAGRAIICWHRREWGSPIVFVVTPSQNRSKNYLAPLMSETSRIIVDARCRTLWPSDVRIDAAHRKDKSGPCRVLCEQENP